MSVSRTSPRVLLWVAIAAYAAGLSALSILRHRAFSTGRFDLGNMVQAVWSTAHGHPLQITGLRGDQISRLASSLRPDPRRLRAALARLAEPGHAARRPGSRRSPSARFRSTGSPTSTSARAERGARLCARLPPLPADAVADAERVPSGRRSHARCCSSPSGTSTRTGSCPFAAFGLCGGHNQGGGRPRRGRARHLVRLLAPGAGCRARRSSSRAPRSRWWRSRS